MNKGLHSATRSEAVGHALCDAFDEGFGLDFVEDVDGGGLVEAELVLDLPADAVRGPVDLAVDCAHVLLTEHVSNKPHNKRGGILRAAQKRCLRLYPLCAACSEKVICLGSNEQEPWWEPDVYIV